MPFEGEVIELDGRLGEEDGDTVFYVLPDDEDAPMPSIDEVEGGLGVGLEVVGRSDVESRVSRYGLLVSSAEEPGCTVSISLLVDELTLKELDVESEWLLAVAERASQGPDA